MGYEKLSPAEAARLEKEKREAEWKAMLKFFIMLEIQKAQARAVEQGLREGEMIGEIFSGMLERVQALKLTDKLFEIEPGMATGAEIVHEIARIEGPDSPFTRLSETLKDKNAGQEERDRSLAECLTNATGHVMKQANEEKQRRIDTGDTALSPQSKLYGRRLRYQMNVLHKTAPAEMYDTLCGRLKSMGLAEPEKDFTAVTEEDLRRDRLTDCRDSMREMSSGQSPRFFKAMNQLNAYLNAPAEANTKAEREALAMTFADYVANDCVPGSRNMDENAFKTAMFGIKSLVPEGQFNQFVRKLNQDPRRSQKLDPASFDALPQAAGLDGPGLDLFAERVLRPSNAPDGQ